nr:hypothetical protein GCM10020093_104380 [Planobispora longispora]
MHEAAHVRQHGREVTAHVVQGRVRGREVPPGQVASGFDLEGGPGEKRAEPVVQVPAEPAALLGDTGDELLAAALELLGERGGPGRRGGLPQDVGQETLIGVGQPGADAGHQGQPPDLRLPVGEGQYHDVVTADDAVLDDVGAPPGRSSSTRTYGERNAVDSTRATSRSSSSGPTDSSSRSASAETTSYGSLRPFRTRSVQRWMRSRSGA